MNKIINIFEALFGFFCAIWVFIYYTGRLNLPSEKEKRRKEKVEKYGGFFILLIIILTISSLTLLIATLL